MSYLKFLWRSKNEHRIHSPFVYELQMNVFKDGMYYSGFDYIAKYLDAHPTTRKEKKKLRQIFRLVNFIKPKTTIEITAEISTYSLALALPSKANLLTIFTNQKEKNTTFIETITSKAKNELESHLKMSKEVDFVLIHSDDNLSNYVDLLSHHLHKNSCIVINQPYKSAHLWEKIKDSQKFNVSIDLYNIGVLFTKPSQTKEHFALRT